MAVFIWFCTGLSAQAHDSALSSLKVAVTGASRVTATMLIDAESAREVLRRVYPEREASFVVASVLKERETILQYIDDRFVVGNEGQRCLRDATMKFELTKEDKVLLAQLSYGCGARLSNISLRSSLFFDEDIPHEILATLVHSRGQERYFFHAKSSASSIFDKKPYLVRFDLSVDAKRAESQARGPKARGVRLARPPSDAFSPERLAARDKKLAARADAPTNPPAPDAQPEAAKSDAAQSPKPQAAEESKTSAPSPKSRSKKTPKVDNLELSKDAELEEVTATSSDFVIFLKDGFLHIFGGLDHILFVLTLVLAVESTRRLVAVVTAFTVAHSLTLVLCALELVRVSPKLVEPLIAASIIYVAIENLLKRAPKHRQLVVFGFGLWHGLGFGERLIGLDLPAPDLAWALFAFNVGVEVGQLAVVLPVFPLLLWLRKSKTELFGKVSAAASVLTALIATWWLFERVFM